MEGITAERPPIRPPPGSHHLASLLERRGGPALFLIGFAVVHALLLQLGYALKPSLTEPAVMWPAAGLALVTLWLSPRRLWPAILIAQFAVELMTAAAWVDALNALRASLFALANMVGALLGAILARWQMRDGVFREARSVVWFVIVTAVGAAVSGAIAAPVNLYVAGRGIDWAQFPVTWQLWSAGQWAGIVAVAPLVTFWLSRLRFRHTDLRLRSAAELVALAVLMAGACLYVYSGRGIAQTLLQLPTTIVLLMIVAVMRLPPRWVVSLFALTSVLMAWLTVRNAVPLPPELAVFGMGQMQMFIVTLGLFAFVLSVTLAERAISARLLFDSEDRYRSFVKLSTEAVWRVELERPMPVNLPLESQVQWLREHACIAEFSQSYGSIDADATAAGVRLRWRPAVPWVSAFEAQLAQCAQHQFSVDGLRFRLPAPARASTFIASIQGVIENGNLVRLWGAARDITEMTELNANLLRERERLKSYARQIVSAEEKARRATAQELQDGIGASLSNLAMMLDAAREDARPEVKLLVEDARARLREVQDKARNMASDLSPPGLYELGLKPALQWLAVYMRGHDNLQVETDVELQEDKLPMETRVLAFKLVRELLGNVVKHAGVQAARVRVRGSSEDLDVQVSDEGRGFEWQLDLFGGGAAGSGLWSIADRVREVGGELTVDTAPGRGARFALRLPLNPLDRTGRLRVLPAGAG